MADIFNFANEVRFVHGDGNGCTRIPNNWKAAGLRHSTTELGWRLERCLDGILNINFTERSKVFRR